MGRENTVKRLIYRPSGLRDLEDHPRYMQVPTFTRAQWACINLLHLAELRGGAKQPLWILCCLCSSHTCSAASAEVCTEDRYCRRQSGEAGGLALLYFCSSFLIRIKFLPCTHFFSGFHSSQPLVLVSFLLHLLQLKRRSSHILEDLSGTASRASWMPPNTSVHSQASV